VSEVCNSKTTVYTCFPELTVSTGLVVKERFVPLQECIDRWGIEWMRETVREDPRCSPWRKYGPTERFLKNADAGSLARHLFYCGVDGIYVDESKALSVNPC
jgi:hypothetical protein